MTSSETPKRGARRFIWLAVGIMVAIGAYTAGWFWVAGEVEARTAAVIERIRGDGGNADCAGAEARGYPFRIGLFCQTVNWADRRGASLRGDGLRTAAQIYNPFHVVGEMDEAWLGTAGAGSRLSTNAKDVRFSARLDQPLPERASLTARMISIDGTPGAARSTIVLTAAASEAHMRRNGQDLDLAFSATDVELSPPGLGRQLRFASLSADVAVEDGVRLAEQRPTSLRGLSGQLRSIAVDTGDDAGLTASGPLSVDADGLVDGELQITVRNPKELAVFLAELFPDQARQIQSAFSGIAMLGDNPSLPLTIRKGRAQIAFITLGTIPPVE
jgi:hypothetical protein